jgi:hypothetical protein
MPAKGCKLTKEHKAKLSTALRKRRAEGSWGDKISSSLTGRRLSMRHRNKVSSGLRKAWGTNRITSEKSARLASERMKKMAAGQVGPKHPRWIHDRSKLVPYKSRPEEHLRWANSVKLKDSFQCALSFVSPCSGCLEAHHIWSPIIRPDLQYDVNNGVTLCRKHHPRKRKLENRLRRYFESLVAQRN